MQKCQLMIRTRKHSANDSLVSKLNNSIALQHNYDCSKENKLKEGYRLKT